MLSDQLENLEPLTLLAGHLRQARRLDMLSDRSREISCIKMHQQPRFMNVQPGLELLRLARSPPCLHMRARLGSEERIVKILLQFLNVRVNIPHKLRGGIITNPRSHHRIAALSTAPLDADLLVYRRIDGKIRHIPLGFELPDQHSLRIIVHPHMRGQLDPLHQILDKFLPPPTSRIIVRMNHTATDRRLHH